MTQTSLLAGDTAGPAGGDFAHLPLDHVWADPDQPRKSFDQEFLGQLAESIRAKGVIQPIVVRLSSPAMADKPRYEQTFTIISGESRWRASQLAEKATIPALIRYDLTEADIAVMQIIENLQRRDLTLAETCEGVTRLVREIGLDKASEQLGKSKSWVSRHSTLGELPPEVIGLVTSGKVESIEIAKDVAQLVQLDAKKGAIVVGRLMGTHTKYGNPVASSSAAPLDEDDLEGLDEQERKAEIEEHEVQRAVALTPPTRAEIRMELGFARQAAERKAQEKAARDAAKADPKLKAEKEKEKAKAAKASAQQKAAREEADRNKIIAEERFKALTKALCELAGLAVPKLPSYGSYNYNEPVTVRAPWRLEGKPESLRYDAHVKNVGIEVFERLDPKGNYLPIDLQLVEDAAITLDEARQIAKLLGNRVRFTAETNLTAAEIEAWIAEATAAKSKAPATGSKNAPVDGALSLNDFITKRVKKKVGARIKSAEFYAAYEKHCKATKATALPFTSNEFGAVIEAQGIEKKRLNTGVHYLDIEVKA